MPVELLVFGILLAGLGFVLLVLLVRLEARVAAFTPPVCPQAADPLGVSAERLGALHAALEGVARELGHLAEVERSLGKVEEGVERLVAALVGRGAGQLGERWAEAHLRWLPDGWVRERVRMGSGEVEFALVLPGERLVPLDSKLVAPDLLRAWEGSDALTRKEVERRLVRTVRERVQEIAHRYLQDPRCAGFGVAAVPDTVYALCRSALRDLALERIVLVPYTLLVPFAMSLYLLGHRLGLAQQGQEARRLEVARDAVRAAIGELERMGQEVTTVSNQRLRALDHLRRASLAFEPEPLGQQTGVEEGDP